MWDYVSGKYLRMTHLNFLSLKKSYGSSSFLEWQSGGGWTKIPQKRCGLSCNDGGIWHNVHGGRWHNVHGGRWKSVVIVSRCTRWSVVLWFFYRNIHLLNLNGVMSQVVFNDMDVQPTNRTHNHVANIRT